MTSPPASGTLLAHLGEPPVRRPQHRRDPLAFGVERGAPGLRGDVLRVVLAEMRLDLVARLGAPAHLAGVDEEDHRAHDAVGERAAIAVGVVGAREADAVLVRVVLDERDRGGVAAERRARQQQAARGAPIRLAQGVAPAERIAAVVHLVEDDEGARVVDEALVHGCLHRDLRVRHGDAVVVTSRRVVPVAEGAGRAGCRRGRRHRPTAS